MLPALRDKVRRFMRMPVMILANLLLVLILSSAPVQAVEHRLTAEKVSAALQNQGFQVESASRTLLGRARIIASRGMIWREVVIDLSTGEILRDYAVEFSPTTPPVTGQGEMPRGGTVLPENHFPGLTN